MGIGDGNLEFMAFAASDGMPERCLPNAKSGSAKAHARRHREVPQPSRQGFEDALASRLNMENDATETFARLVLRLHKPSNFQTSLLDLRSRIALTVHGCGYFHHASAPTREYESVCRGSNNTEFRAD